MNNELLVHDTGRVKLWVLLLITPFGLLGSYGGFLNLCKSLIPSLFCALLGFILLSSWFWRTRLFFDPSRREIIFRGSTMFWIPRRLSLAGATAVGRHDVRILTSAISGTDVSIRYQDGRESWLTRVPPGDPEHLATLLSEIATLPIAG